MDREKAIQILKRCEAESHCEHYKRHYCCIGCGQREALDLAIEALEKLQLEGQKSKLESEQMREYIPKDEVLDIIKSMPRDLVEEYVYELDGIWLDDDEEKLQLDGETSTNAKDIVEQIEKHVERIKAETDKNPDSLWSKGMKSFDGWEKQVTSKLNNPDDSLLTEDSEACKEQKSKLESDIISRQAAIEAIEKAYCNPCKERGDDYNEVRCRACNFDDAINQIDALPPVEPKPVCEDAISREWIKNALLKYGFTAPDMTVTELIEDAPQVEPERPKRTETIMVDGEPTEIDPLSYEVGYTHGQSERPKGEWIFNPKDAIDLMFTKPKCNKCGFESADGGNFCSNCGADCRGDKE